MEGQHQKSWFRRNWLWFVPSMGCLTLILFFILGIVGIFSFINDSEPTKVALELATNHPKVIEALGEPIEKYSIPKGEISYNSDSGSRVDLGIPIRGPKGEGILFVKGKKTGKEWDYEILYVLIKETQEKINLLEKSLELT